MTHFPSSLGYLMSLVSLSQVAGTNIALSYIGALTSDEVSAESYSDKLNLEILVIIAVLY